MRLSWRFFLWFQQINHHLRIALINHFGSSTIVPDLSDSVFGALFGTSKRIWDLHAKRLDARNKPDIKESVDVAALRDARDINWEDCCQILVQDLAKSCITFADRSIGVCRI